MTHDPHACGRFRLGTKQELKHNERRQKKPKQHQQLQEQPPQKPKKQPPQKPKARFLAVTNRRGTATRESADRKLADSLPQQSWDSKYQLKSWHSPKNGWCTTEHQLPL